MGCRSINVLRLGLGMFSMNLSLSHATRELERPNNQDGIVDGLSVSLLVLSYQTTSSIYQIKQLNTTAYEGLLTAH